MSLELKQNVQLSAKLAMTPSMQLGLKILAMNSSQLNEAIESELKENPTLEEWVQEETDWRPTASYQKDEEPDHELPVISTFSEYLLSQIHLDKWNIIEREIATRLIGEMDEEGSLSLVEVDEEELKPSKRLSTKERLRALEIENRPKLDNVTHTFSMIAEELDWPVNWVQSVWRRIQTLDFNWKDSAVSPIIIPEVRVIKSADEFAVILNDEGLPKLRINSSYRDQIRKKDSSEASQFVRKKIQAALWLIRCIHKRQSMIGKVVESIVNFQRSWFEGTASLSSLTMQQVAADIGVHESTISRTVHEKYVETPHGIFELRYFFSSHAAEKEMLKNFIHHEDKQQPLTDEALVEKLKLEGFSIARRTVAKYRKQLNIASFWERKKHAIF